MSDPIDRIDRCVCCNGALVRTPDDNVTVPSTDSHSVETEASEFVCNECWTRLASERERHTTAQGVSRRRT